MARSPAGDLAGIHGRAVDVIANDAMGGVVGAGNPAMDLGVMDMVGKRRERLRWLVPRLRLHCAPIDGTAVEPRRRPGLQPSEHKAQAFQSQRQAGGRRFSHTPGRDLMFSNMDETPQKGAGGQHHRPYPELSSIGEPEPRNALMTDDEIIGLGLDHGEPWGVGNGPLDGCGVKPTVGLGARPAHRRTFAAVEDPELHAPRVGGPANQPVKGVDLADQMAFAEAPDSRIARHRADGRNSMGDERRAGSHARGRGGRLATGMASPHDDDVVMRAHRLESRMAGFYLRPAQASILTTDLRAECVSRETLKARGPLSRLCAP